MACFSKTFGSWNSFVVVFPVLGTKIKDSMVNVDTDVAAAVATFIAQEETVV